MDLIINQKRSKKNKHLKTICDLIEWADRCVLCTSFIDGDGLKGIRDSIELGIKNNNLNVTLISNNEYTKQSEIDSLTDLESQYESFTHILDENSTRLHTKLYYFEQNDSYVAIVGSANLTGNGLIRNEELSVRLEGAIGSDDCLKFKAYISRLYKINGR